MDDSESIPDHHKTLVGYLLGCGIALINLEFMLLRDVIDNSTKEKGELIKSLHSHPLFFELNLRCHFCDICHERTKAPYFELRARGPQSDASD